MSKKITLIIIIVFGLISFGCQMNNGNSENSQQDINTTIATEDTDENTYETLEENNTEREPTDDEINEYGIVTSFEDIGYPRYVCTIEFPERQMSYDFNVNMEDIDFVGDKSMDFVGKYVTFYYLTQMENNLIEMQYQGKSVFGEYAPESIDPEWEIITGILSGADESTNSDLPGEVFITDNDGTTLNFEYFVDDDMVKVNGKEVTVFYSRRDMSTITYIKISED